MHAFADDVAIIDEIQLLRDSTRGWAWTRALLGLVAKEIHVCGEAAAIPLVQQLAEITGDELEVGGKQGCGVGRIFRIPTPDSSSFKNPTPAI